MYSGYFLVTSFGPNFIGVKPRKRKNARLHGLKNSGCLRFPVEFTRPIE